MVVIPERGGELRGPRSGTRPRRLLRAHLLGCDTDSPLLARHSNARRHLALGVRFAVVSAMLAAVSATACRRVLGVDDYRTGPAPSDAATASDASYMDACGHVSYKSEACRDCVTKSCCPQATACDADPGCAAMIRCLARCKRVQFPIC
jgi:hypothetical protein